MFFCLTNLIYSSNCKFFFFFFFFLRLVFLSVKFPGMKSFDGTVCFVVADA